MTDFDQRIQHAIERTQVVRPPKQDLATFGVTNIRYYLVTEPSYSELEDLAGKAEETVVRDGRVIAEKPKIVTPFYLANMFEGFEHGKEYAEYIMRRYGSNEPGLLYRYRNETGGVNIVSGSVEAVVSRLNDVVDRDRDPLSAIVRGVDELWDVSLMKLVHDVARQSLRSNVMELYQKGLLSIDRRGVPQDARVTIEELFSRVERGEADPSELKAELDAWDLFEEYQDRFLRLFRRG
ncbi:MAG: hypothetical protein AB1603_08625 [Chloroflexota bacterium]